MLNKYVDNETSLTKTEFKSNGGGLGQYSEIDGDVPLAVARARGIKSKNAYRKEDLNCMESMTIITYNAHSVMSETRLTMLLLELEDIEWDIVVVEETWREPRKEVVHLESGHIWYGSGGCRGRCGVGFLVHKRIGKCKFTAINERLAILDVDCIRSYIYPWSVHTRQ